MPLDVHYRVMERLGSLKSTKEATVSPRSTPVALRLDLAKRWQHLNATSQHNTSQHCWASIWKPRPNDRNISQHCWAQQV